MAVSGVNAMPTAIYISEAGTTKTRDLSRYTPHTAAAAASILLVPSMSARTSICFRSSYFQMITAIIITETIILAASPRACLPLSSFSFKAFPPDS